MTDERNLGDVVVEWYRHSLNDDRGAGRAARARLRRGDSPVEALAVAETHILYERLKEAGKRPSPEQLALLAVTFARLKGIHGDKLAASFGKRGTKDAPRTLSELRFQSLIRVRSFRGLIAPLRRCLAVLGPEPSCNGWALARDLYFWSDKVRNDWCFQYFDAGLAGTNYGEIVQ